MAMLIYGRASGMDVTSAWQYQYLFDSFPITVLSTTTNVTKLYVDIDLVSLSNENVVISSQTEWGDFDIYEDKYLNIDLMALAEKLLKKDVYKFGKTTDFNSNGYGVNSLIPEYRVIFSIRTDVDAAQEIKLIPILGNHIFSDLTFDMNQNSNLNEFEVEGVTQSYLQSKWSGGYLVSTTLANPASSNVTPTITPIAMNGTCEPEFFLLWKSRLGGWMSWGFEISSIVDNHEYIGEVEVNQFRWNNNSSGNPVLGNTYIPVNYTGVEYSRTFKLKSLSLEKDELKAVSGINFSPAVYLMEPSSNKMELVRMTSVSAPVDSLAGGGDFNVTVKTISKGRQNVL